jgi:TolB-like protein
MKRVTVLVVAALACALTPFPPADATERLWILPFENPSEEPALRHLEEGLPALLATLVSASEEHALVDRENLDRILVEQSITLPGLVADGPRRDIGDLLGATLIVTGSFRRDGARLVLDTRVVDVGTGVVVGTAKGGGSAEELGRLTEQLYEDLQRELHGRLPEPVTAQVDRAPVSNLHFMKGLGYYFSARYERALAEFIAGSGDARSAEVFAWWRARCHLKRDRHDQAYLELLRIREGGPDRGDLDQALRECLEHLGPQEVEMIRRLAEIGARGPGAGG